MEESQQGNHKGKGKGKNIEKYKVWSMDESNELLKLMVDAGNRGWRDKSGLLSKQTVEKRILPILERMNQSINKLNQSIDSIDTRDYSCWDLIKEIPNLDKQAQYKALKLLNTRAKKIEFYKMTPQERSDWINFELQN